MCRVDRPSGRADPLVKCRCDKPGQVTLCVTECESWCAPEWHWRAPEADQLLRRRPRAVRRAADGSVERERAAGGEIAAVEEDTFQFPKFVEAVRVGPDRNRGRFGLICGEKRVELRVFLQGFSQRF